MRQMKHVPSNNCPWNNQRYISESESEIHLFEPHSIIQNKYFNVIIIYKNVDRETPAKAIWSLSQGPPKL